MTWTSTSAPSLFYTLMTTTDDVLLIFLHYMPTKVTYANVCERGLLNYACHCFLCYNEVWCSFVIIIYACMVILFGTLAHEASLTTTIELPELTVYTMIKQGYNDSFFHTYCSCRIHTKSKSKSCFALLIKLNCSHYNQHQFQPSLYISSFFSDMFYA